MPKVETRGSRTPKHAPDCRSRVPVRPKLARSFAEGSVGRMRHMLVGLVLGGSVALAAAGCGGSSAQDEGAKLYRNTGCNACHSLSGVAVHGPTWLHLYGSEVELEDGTKVKVDDAYLTESIKEPSAQIVKGWADKPQMPTNNLTDAQIKQVIGFIKAAKNGQPE